LTELPQISSSLQTEGQITSHCIELENEKHVGYNFHTNIYSVLLP